MKLIESLLKGDALKNDITNANPDTGAVIWWLGQSGFLVKSSQGTVLFDPYLSDSLTEKYATTDKPHVRMTELAIAPEGLDGVDLITSTHNHTDHLDAATLLPLFKANPNVDFVIPEANRAFVADRLGCELQWPSGLSDGESVELGELKVHAVAAAHNEVDRDDSGKCRYLGYVVQLGAVTVYHSGDTMMYDGIVEQLKPFDIDLAILPINGYKPERRVSGNLFGDEAARLAHAIGASQVVPCHYDMFTFNTETTELFEQTCTSLGQAYTVLRCGESVRIGK